MKAKKIILSSLAVASAGALAAGVYKIAKDQKRLRTQEELVAEVREQMEAMGTIATLYVELYESSEERLVGGVIFEDERHYRFVYEDGLLHYDICYVQKGLSASTQVQTFRLRSATKSMYFQR